MHFVVVTPCLEPDDRLCRTVQSVARQTVLDDPGNRISYAVELASGAGALSFSAPERSNLDLVCHRRRDSGMYDALVRGFGVFESGDVHCYLGAGDYLSPCALEIVSEVFRQGEEWVTGMICGYNDRGHLVEAMVPYRYRSRLIEAGMYGPFLPYVQQESTFWSGRLHELVDWEQVRELSLAGDAMIWRSLARHAPMRVVEAWLGGFERRAGQLSVVHAGRYREELRGVSRRPSVADCAIAMCDWLIWRCPRSVKRSLGGVRYVYDPQVQAYCRWSR